MKISLYGKFVFFTIGAMLLSFFLAFFIINTFYHQYFKDINDDKNMGIVKNISSFIESHPNLDAAEFLTAQADAGYKMLLTNDKDVTLFFGDPFRQINLPDDVTQDVLQGQPYHGMRDLPKETFVTGFFSDELANSVGVPVEIEGKTYALFLRPDIKFLFNEIHYLLGGLFVGMAIISIVFMLYVARKLVEPISKLTVATKQIGKEQFAVDLPLNRIDEIGQLAKSFQLMAEQLEESDQLRKQFINDVSHDFQTPLQNIQGYAALLEDDNITNEDRVKYSSIIQSETTRLSTLTKQLLLLTSLDNLSNRLFKKPIRIDTQIKNVLQGFRWQMEEKHISFSTDLEEATVLAHEGFIEKIWENLISNAIKYTESNGMIDISLIAEKNEIIVTVKDSGIGMEEDVIPHLFDRFYRVDSARHASVEGTGLGLAIVEEVVKLHEGTIQVESQPLQGTTFTVRLPRITEK